MSENVNTMDVKESKGGIKEFFRKKIVSLKRNPAIIPIIFLVISFLIYSLNLTSVSDSTAKIQGTGMGLCEFAMMLANMLAFICMLNAYPRRQKPNVLMIVLLCVMLVVIIVCSIIYQNAIMEAITREVSPIDYKKNTYIVKAYNMLNTYRVFIIITAVLALTVPVYGKWIRKINTSVVVEGNDEMGAIELDGDDDAEAFRAGGKRNKEEASEEKSDE